MRIPFGKLGPKVDPRGMDCTLQYQGRTLLGKIRAIRYREVPASYVLDVTFFNGEPWPITPAALAVDVLER